MIAIPYHRDLEESGEPTEGGATIDLQAYDGRRLQASFKSRMMGQDWQFSVRASAPVIDGGGGRAACRAAQERRARAAYRAGVSDAVARKRALARLGVRIQGGRVLPRHPGRDDRGRGSLHRTRDERERGEARWHARHRRRHDVVRLRAAGPRPPVIATLLKAGANPNGRDSNNSTALIWAAESCPVDAITDADQGGRRHQTPVRRGGATALGMAEALKRPDIAAALKAAGAKPGRVPSHPDPSSRTRLPS